ncbi:MAG: serine/threonine-protein kinase [Deltaproteobacteria bacterium]|nr:serine/threonine-protein kinase [Deltaproteobacteria bacterium]
MDSSASATDGFSFVIGMTVGGRYLLKRLLGGGSLGVVFEVQDTSDPSSSLAIKLFRLRGDEGDAMRARFLREGTALTKLRCDEIVRVFEVGQCDEHSALFVVSELVEGESLRAYLQRFDRIEPSIMRALVADLLAALTTVHAAGLVHRDIKPENIILVHTEGRPRAKLLDFALIPRSIDASVGLSNPGSFAGTLAYASPEQLRGVAIVRPSSDLWSLGVVIYEMCMGELPWDRGDSSETIEAILRGPVVSLHAIDGTMCEVVRRCLVRTAEDRAQTAPELARLSSAQGSANSLAKRDLRAPLALALMVLALAGWLVMCARQ